MTVNGDLPVREVVRAVDRVDDPDRPRLGQCLKHPVVGLVAFLADDAAIGQQCRQVPAQCCFGFLVGDGNEVTRLFFRDFMIGKRAVARQNFRIRHLAHDVEHLRRIVENVLHQLI